MAAYVPSDKIRLEFNISPQEETMGEKQSDVFEIVAVGPLDGSESVEVVKYDKKLAARSAVHAAFLAGADAKAQEIGPVSEVRVRPFCGA